MTSAFYVPAPDPIYHDKDAAVGIRVNSLRANTLVPFDYYYLPFCQPATMIRREQGLADILFGDRIVSSPYKVNMLRNESCVRLTCNASNAAAVVSRADEVEKFINNGYRAGMNIDNLPGFKPPGIFENNAQPCTAGTYGSIDPQSDPRNLNLRGYALGVPKICVDKTLLNNHLHFRIFYNKRKQGIEGTGGNYSIVGFHIIPFSIAHQADGGDCDSNFNPQVRQQSLSMEEVKAGKPIHWSYSVTWYERSNVTWATRWDEYLSTSYADSAYSIHWQSIIWTLALAIILLVIVTSIVARALKADIYRYNSRDPEDTQEEFGWKLIHADVFRKPKYASWFAIAVGNGTQVLLMFAAALLMGCIGYASPANRGFLAMTALFVFVACSSVSGYVCARLLKFFDLKSWRTVALNAMAFPGLALLTIFIVNIGNYSVGADDAIDFVSVLKLLFLWIVGGGVLGILGAATGFHEAAVTAPVAVGKLPREIPLCPWFLNPYLLMICAPCVPLLIASLELGFIFDSIWRGAVYYVFGFLFITFLLWLIAVMLMTIFCVYYQLCYENHLWWWHSFAFAGGLGVHFFLWCVNFYYWNLDVQSTLGQVLYFSYCALAAIGYGLAAGSVGFAASSMFVKVIYGSIKIE